MPMLPDAADRAARRRVLRTLTECAAVAPLLVAWPRWARAQSLAPTPACGSDRRATDAQTEGPYFKRRSPQRDSLLEPGLAGSRLVLSGLVVATDCRPIPAALLDFWQADAQGQYDNSGSRLRGHMYTDAQGGYRLETIEPGLYSGRTRHIHVKVQAPAGRVLTTQLYFPNEPANRDDGIFSPLLVVALSRIGEQAQARFDFVLQRA